MKMFSDVRLNERFDVFVVVYVSETRREGGYLEDSRSEVARPAITGLSQAVISRSAYIDKVYKL